MCILLTQNAHYKKTFFVSRIRHLPLREKMNELVTQFNPKEPENYRPTEIEQRIGLLLTKNKGNITYVAAEYPSTRWNIYYHIKRSLYLQFVFEDARERRVDEAERKLDEAIERGEAWAIALVLRTLGRGRGYIEKVEQSGSFDHRHPIEDWKQEAERKIKQLQEAADKRNGRE